MTNKFNLKQGIKKYYPLGFLFILIFGFVLIQTAKAKEISVGTASDNIGIGTSAPGTTYRLNVNGNSNITGTLNVTGGITGSSLGSTLLGASNVSAGAFGSNSGGGNYSFPGSLNVTSGVVSATVGGNTNPGSTAFQAREYNFGTTDISHIEQNAPRIGFHWGNRYWGQITYFNSMFSFRNSDLGGYVPITAADGLFLGSVGVGTTVPSAKLQVIGNAKIGSNNNQGLWIDSTSGPDWGTQLYLTQDLASTQGAIKLSADYSLGGGAPNFVLARSKNSQAYGSNPNSLTYSPAFMVNGANGNIGIGTVSPKQKLDVIGNVGIGAVASNFSDEGPNIHIWTSDIPIVGYGVGGSNPANILVEENDAEQSLAFLGPNSATQKIVFGRTSDSGAGQISFNHNTSQYNITGGNVNVAGTFTAGNMGGANLVPNSTNMSAFNSSLASLTFVDGKTIQALDSPQNGSGGCYQWGETAMIPVNANNDYEFSIWVKANGIQNVYFGFFVYDSNRSQISSGNLGNPYFHTSSEQTNDGWVKITAHLRSSATPHDSSYIASVTSNKSGPNVSDYVMPTNTSYSMIRFGSCYGGTSTAGRVYMYNPVIREVSTLYDSNYGAIWSKFNGSDYNVGIGTSNPGAYKLNVNGSINATSITGAMSGTLNAANLSSGTFGSNTGGGEYTFPGKLYLNAAEGLGVYGIRGRNANEQIEMYNSVSIGSPNGWTVFPQAPNFGLSVYGGANFATNQGSVGIGTTGPNAKLDVRGNATIGDVLNLGNLSSVSTSAYRGITWESNFSDGNYAIYKPAGGWTQPLHIAFYTGIKIGADTGYGGTRFYNSSAMGSELMSVGNGDANVRITNTLFPGRVQASAGSNFNGNGYSFNGGGDTDGGMFSPADGTLVFATNNTEKMRIVPDGSVGIGVTPGLKLDVAGDIRARGNVYTDNNYGNGLVGVYTSTRYQGVFSMGDAYKLPADGSSTGNLYGLAWSHPNAGGVASNLNTHGLLVMENGTFLAAISGSIRARDDMQAPIFYDRNDPSYYVNPNSTSNMNYINGTISNAQKVNGIDSNPDNSHPGTGMRPFYSWNLGQANNASSGYSNGISIGSHPGDQSYGFQIVQNMWDDNLYFRRYNAGWQTWYSVVYKDSSNNSVIGGTMTAAGFIYNSDVKLKKNIATIESPLTKILKLRGVTFNWKKDNTPGVGLIAQEVEQVFPELVSEQNGIKSVQYGNLVAPLIEAVKEQQKEIQSLNERIKVLEAK